VLLNFRSGFEGLKEVTGVKKLVQIQ